MADEPVAPETLDRPWRLWASAAILGALLVGALLAFLVIPSFQRANAGVDLWTAVCRSLGIVEGSPAYRQPTGDAKAVPVSQVAWGPRVFDLLDGAQPERGARVAAETCFACHGEKGVSVTPDLPSLVGQSPAAIYKQLFDYRTGARVHPQMTPVARQLALPDLANVAAYFGGRAEVIGLGARDHPADLATCALPTRGIPDAEYPRATVAMSMGPAARSRRQSSAVSITSIWRTSCACTKRTSAATTCIAACARSRRN